MDEISRYINMISDMGDKYGDTLIKMLNYYNKGGLRELTLEQVKEFYYKLRGEC